MTMIFQLLVFTCACALGAADDDLANKNRIDALYQAIQILQDNVVSMDGNIPTLNDPRRHYAAIAYVVNAEAHANLKPGHDYYKDYERNINESLTVAVANPQLVIQGTQQTIDDVLNAIENGTVPQQLNSSAKEIYDAAETVAIQVLQDDKDYFAPASQNLSSFNFVLTGAEKLEKLVTALKNLYVLLYGPV